MVDDIARHSSTSTAGCCDDEFFGFLQLIHDQRPPRTQVRVILDHSPGALLDTWAASKSEIEICSTPSATTWGALATRSVAATTIALHAHNLPSPVPQLTAHLQRGLHNAAAATAAWVQSPSTVASALDVLRTPPPRRRASRIKPAAVVPPAVAMQRLRDRRPHGFATDLPPFEQLIHLRQRADEAGLVQGDILDAMVVLADLTTLRTIAEATVIQYCRDIFTDPWQVARRLGVGSPNAVGQRRRRLTDSAGRQNRMPATTPDPRHDIRVTETGRLTNPVDDALRDLHTRWLDDLVDHEHRIERVPTGEDIFDLLAYLVDPHRPVLRSTDPGVLNPVERRQADGLAGLTLVTDLRHRLQRERLYWYRLNDDLGVSLRELGSAFGRSPSAVVRDRHRLERRVAQHDGSAADATAAPAYWRGLDSTITAAIAALKQHRELFADDEDQVFWLDQLDLEPPITGIHARRLIDLVDDLRAPRPCAGCGQPQAPVIAQRGGSLLCARSSCGGHSALADVLESATKVVEELRTRRQRWR